MLFKELGACAQRRGATSQHVEDPQSFAVALCPWPSQDIPYRARPHAAKLPAFCSETSLPPQAKKFLRLMTAHKRPNTVRGYQTRLRHFYAYLHRRQLGLENFTRLDFEEYLASMHRDGYAPQTRRHAIGAVQTYLSWLYECGILASATLLNRPA